MRMIVVDGPMEGTEFQVSRLPLTIGRSSTNADFSLERDALLSRSHCRLFNRDGHLCIEDLETRNGTWVEGVRIDKPVALTNGSSFTVGDSRLSVHDIDGLLAAPTSLDPVTVDEWPGSDTEPTTRLLDPSTVTLPVRPPEQDTAVMSTEPIQVELLQRRLKVLEDVAAALTDRTDLGQAFRVALDGILTIAPGNRAVALVRGDDGELLPMLVRPDSGKDAVQISRTIVRRAVDDRLTVLIHDAQSDVDLAKQQSVQIAMIRSAMCVPLTVDGQVKAAFYLDAKMPRAFTDDEVRLVTAVANQTALALAHASLTTQLQSVSEQLQAARQRSDSLLEAFRSMAGSG